MPQALALARKDWHASRNRWAMLARESLFKVGFILLFAAALLTGLFALFYEGFHFLASFGGAGFMVMHRLFSLFFMGLGVMLVISSVVTSYSTVFRSREVGFLLTRPFDVGTIILYKYIEATMLSSWAFFFVVIPFTGAYAWHEGLGVRFAAWTLAFSLPFLFLCSALGTLIAMALVRWGPRGRALWAGVLAAAGWILYRLLIREVGRGSEDPVFLLTRLVPGFKLSSLPLMPSWWAAEGIKACSAGHVGRGLMLWTVLVANTLAAGLAVHALGERTFYDALQRVLAGGGGRRRAVLFAIPERWLGFLPRDMRALVVKDIRTFFRDPMQWSQVLVFFGLLALYFVSIRSFQYHRLPLAWRNLVTFLNVFSVAAVECSLASRFVYPQLSLEGQAFWMLGLSPTTARRILFAKFASALVSMVAVSATLILLSAGMLGVGGLVMAVALALVIAISCAVCALSTGLGAVYLDLRTSNPAAIVSGFGGTVNLVLSLIFMLVSILPFGVVFHLASTRILAQAELLRALILPAAWLVAVTAAGTVIPLWLGQRSLERREY